MTDSFQANRLYWIWAVLPILPFIIGFAILNILNDEPAELQDAFLEIAVTVNPDAFKEPTDNAAIADQVSDGEGISPEQAAEGYEAEGKSLSEDEIAEQTRLDLIQKTAPLFESLGVKVKFLNQFFFYVSVSVFHLTGCAAVFLYMAYKSWLSPARDQIAVIFLISLGILGATNFAARQDWFDGALHLAYRNVCDILVLADAAPQILPKINCSESGISKFAWLAAFPYIFGLLAAASASAVVSGLISGTAEDAKARYDQVTIAFQATAFVLVTSMLALVLFYQLPTSVIVNDDATALIDGYAEGITLYWGVLFTVTIVAIFAPANLILRSQMKQDDETPELGGSKLFLDERTRNMAKTALTTLAPLLVGSAGPVFESIANALSGG